MATTSKSLTLSRGEAGEKQRTNWSHIGKGKFRGNTNIGNKATFILNAGKVSARVKKRAIEGLSACGEREQKR